MNIAISILVALQLSMSDTIPLSLGEAVCRAEEANPTLRAERASAEAAHGRVLEGTRAFLPTLRFDVQGVRSTDPVAVFGLKLRQENFEEDDLSLDALNRPEPYAGYASSATVELPIFAPEGLYGYAAAKGASKARGAAAARASGATRFGVVRAYWDALLSRHRVDAMDEALSAVRAHAEQAEALLEQGLVTGLDARLARVHAGAVEVRQLAAVAEAENALSFLGALLAFPDTARIVLTDHLSQPLEGTGEDTCRSAEAICDLAARGDLKALRFGVDAASAAVKSAWGSNIPSVALFGSIEQYARSSPWGPGSGQWSLGIGVTWTPVRGLAGVGAVRSAKSERSAAAARLEAAERQARVEALRAARFLAAALESVAVAARSDAEARSALDQARLRYRTGTSSITELLNVQTATTSTTLGLFQARRDLLVAHAALDFAYGVYDR